MLGSGSWGTALACLLARNQHQVTVWGRDTQQILQLQSDHINHKYLPSVQLPKELQFSADFTAATSTAEAIVLALPTAAFRSTLQKLRDLGLQKTPLIWACKGVEHASGKLLHTVIEEEFGSDAHYGVISGPTFATEVALGMPAAVSLAANDAEFCREAALWFHGSNLRAYTSDDLIGVQLGGALKNVLAIAAGIADGLELGANSRAALITRGLAELMRLGEAMGGRRETFMGLAGLGDLVLTCTDNQSRNRRMGLALAKGLSVERAYKEIGQAVEGVKTAYEASQLAQKYKVAMPITEQVQGVISGNILPRQAVTALLSRDPVPEAE